MQNEILLKIDAQMESLNQKGLVIFQPQKGYRFSIDAVLLARFMTLKNNFKVAIDLGTGSGIIPLLLTTRKRNLKIVGIEIQEDLAELARMSVQVNNLEKSIEIIQTDLKKIPISYYEQFDLAFSNPPFFKKETGKISNIEMEAIARHELCCELEDIIHKGSRLLKTKGFFSMIHRPERLEECFSLLMKYNLSPTRLCFVHPKEGKEATMFLLEAVKGTKQSLKVNSPLFVYEGKSNKYTERMNKIFDGAEI